MQKTAPVIDNSIATGNLLNVAVDLSMKELREGSWMVSLRSW